MKAYKYRSIEKEVFERDFETIKNNSFFSSNYDMLNDPFDIYFNENISRFINSLKILFPIKELDNVESQFKEILKFKEEVGVYCLSKDFLNEQLWAYYASSYSGYCIEYDLDKLVDKEQNFDFQYQLKIDYRDDIPTLGVGDIKNLQNSLIRKMFATKKSTWSREEEIRLIFDKYGMKKFHSSAITGIYFGIKTPESIKESFYDLFKNQDVKFYEVFPSSFELDSKLINETKRELKFDINKFEFEILQHRMNMSHESYYIFYKSSKNESEIKEFILAFREKFCIKENSLYIFDNKEVENLLDVYPKNDSEYLNYANSIIIVSDDWEEPRINNPYKDFYYNEIIERRMESI